MRVCFCGQSLDNPDNRIEDVPYIREIVDKLNNCDKVWVDFEAGTI